jgi:hypothetical protein
VRLPMCVGAIAALGSASVSNAAYLGLAVYERPMSTPEELILGVYAVYDNPDDRLLGVGGPASFTSTLELYNDPSGFDVYLGIDFDSWVASGAETGATFVTPGWPGGSNGGSGGDNVGGTNWSMPYGEAWFEPGGTFAAQSDDGLANHILIASFAFSPTETAVHAFTFGAELATQIDGEQVRTPFMFTHTFEVIPAPGALAALAVAGLAGDADSAGERNARRKRLKRADAFNDTGP